MYRPRKSSELRIGNGCRSERHLETFVLAKFAEASNCTFEEMVRDAADDPHRWHQQYGNYKYAFLFAIKQRNIRKYYCGWSVFCRLAAGNIRFLLELVDDALTRHLASGTDVLAPVASDVQTHAAQNTGHKRLRDLESSSLSGARLTKLLLGLGRVLQVMALDPAGHAPEVNQFHVSDYGQDKETDRRVVELLTDGVTHLALVRYRANKLQESHDVRNWDYFIHPVFSAFFGFSHRQKRKMEVRAVELLALTGDDSASTIKTILKRQNRDSPSDLPEQMKLFSGYYAISS